MRADYCRKRLDLFALGVVCGGVWLVMATSAHASTITVTTQLDELTVNGNCSLREAVQASNTDTVVDSCPAGHGADTLVIPAGNYSVTLGMPDPPISDTLTFTHVAMFGDFDITGTLTLEGAGADKTVISGGDYNAFHLYRDSQVTMRGVTIRNSKVNRSSLQYDYDYDTIYPAGYSYVGGAIYSQGDLTIINTDIISNTAGIGAGIYSSKALTVVRSILAENVCEAYYGNDYVYLTGGGIYSVGNLHITESIIRNNTCEGIYTKGTADIQRVEIYGNSSFFPNGGAIELYGSLNLIDSQIHNNVANGQYYKSRWDGGQGGAIHGSQLGTVYISRTNIYSNSAEPFVFVTDRAPGKGGGISLDGTEGTVVIESTAIFSNSADQHGGVSLEGTNAIFKNVTISGNQALTQSGGLGLEMEAIAVLSHTTIASNTSPIASITANSGQILMDHVLISTQVGAGCSIVSGSIDASAGHNLSSDASCALTGTTNLSNTNPLIGPLSREMSTWVHMLLPASPAINTGAPPQQGEVDQVGWPRKWGGEFSDIGAYERIDFSALTRVMLPLVLATQ